MTFSDLAIAVGRSSRAFGYVRDNLGRIWTPGGGRVQQGYCEELAGAMCLEADEFFDRAIVLYLLRSKLRRAQAATWAAVASYYSNYFSAVSFVRLHMRSVTHTPGGGLFEVVRTGGPIPVFEVSQRPTRLSHKEAWGLYYRFITQMAWPDANSVAVLAPTMSSLRYREQMFREKVNYRPGEGFDEIYMSPSRYTRELREALKDDGGPVTGLSDPAYNDRLAGERLTHVANLLKRLGGARKDPAIEAARWSQRRMIVERYADGPAEKRFASGLIQ